MATTCNKVNYRSPAHAKFMLMKLRKIGRAQGKEKLPSALYPCRLAEHEWHLTSDRTAAKPNRSWSKWQLSEAELAAA